MSRLRCEVCGKDDLIPFKCSYCGKVFCAEHRLPEKHECASQPMTPPSYISERIARLVSGRSQENDDLDVFLSTLTTRRARLKRWAKRTSRRMWSYAGYAGAILLGATPIIFLLVAQTLSHDTMKHNEVLRFYFAQSASLLHFASSTGWLIFGVGIPVILPLSVHSYWLCVKVYSVLGVLFVSIVFGGKKAFVICLVGLLLIGLIAAEYERASTRDFLTLTELKVFLLGDSTDHREYSSNFTCIDFSFTLIERARGAGFRMYFDSRSDHAFCEAYIIEANRWVEIEPQTDQLQWEEGR